MNSPLIIFPQQDKVLSLLYRENRLIQANAHPREGSDLEAIYIGKVKNVVPSLEAAFVEYKAGKMGFLPLKKVKHPLITNRSWDGRLVAGDEILIQVEKEEIKTKASGLTCNLSFTGKYTVLTSGRRNLGYSGKLSGTQKDCLRHAITERFTTEYLQKEGVGLIVRTNAGELEDLQPLFQEVEDLLVLKKRIFEEAMHRTCFSRLYQPAPAWISGIRDLYGFSCDRILTDDPDIFQQIQEYLPDEKRLELYQDQRIPLNRLYNVKTRLEEALAQKVWLKSGAYLIIQPTEALTVIDVNSGKLQKKKPGDDIFYRINLEAAAEIALQLRLRNISGIIIIDFISQDSDRLDKQLLQELTNLVKNDPVQTDVIDMTPLGLVELTRKKINKSLSEQLKNQGERENGL